MPLALAGQERLPRTGDRLGIEVAFPAKARGIEQRCGPVAQVALQPRADRRAEAVAAFTRAAELDPTDPEVLARLSSAYLTTNDFEAALAAADRAVAVAPTNMAALWVRVQALLWMRSLREAEIALKSGDRTACAEIDAHFHQAVVSAGGNALLSEVYDVLRVSATEQIGGTLWSMATAMEHALLHRRLVEAIAAQDEIGARLRAAEIVNLTATGSHSVN